MGFVLTSNTSQKEAKAAMKWITFASRDTHVSKTLVWTSVNRRMNVDEGVTVTGRLLNEILN